MENPGKSTMWWSPWIQMTAPLYNFNLMFEKTDFVQHTWDKLWLAPREKPIHRRGVMQQVEWIEEPGQPYTGLFKGGKGLVRYSLGTKNNPYKASMLPGIAFKFFRDGVGSGGIHTLTLDEHKTNNYFEHGFSNHIKE